MKHHIANGPLVLLYHRVADDPIDSQLLAVSIRRFDEQLKALSRHFHVVPLNEMVEKARQGDLLSATAALTFDDGYLDNLIHALPLLEKHRMHATIFVTSGMVGADREFWWDALERIFLTCEPLPESLSIKGDDRHHELDMCSPENRTRAYEQLCGSLRTGSAKQINAFVDGLYQWAGLSSSPRFSHTVVDEEDLKRLASSSCIEIGSHGVGHGIFSLMKEEDQRREIKESKQRLEAIIQKPVRFFSYPYGTASDFNQTTKRILKEEGFEAGIANMQGAFKKPYDFYAVPRRLVRNWTGEVFENWIVRENMDRREAETLSRRINNLISRQYETVYGDMSYE